MTFELAVELGKAHDNLEVAPSLNNPDDYVVKGQLGDFLAAQNQVLFNAKKDPDKYKEIIRELEELPERVRWMDLAHEAEGLKAFYTKTEKAHE